MHGRKGNTDCKKVTAISSSGVENDGTSFSSDDDLLNPVRMKLMDPKRRTENLCSICDLLKDDYA